MGYMNCQIFTISSCFARLMLSSAILTKVGEIFLRWQFCDMENATKYLVVGSLGILMTQRDIASLAVKGLISITRT